MGEDSDHRDGVSTTSRRAVLTTGVALSAGCLRLSEDTQGPDSNETQDGGNDGSDGNADTTGNGDSNDRITSNVDVVGSTGQVGENSEEVIAILLVVKRSPGSEEIDLSEISIQYVGDNGSGTLVHASRDPPGFYLSALAAEQEDNAIMAADSDRYQIIIPLETSELTTVFQADDPVDGTAVIQDTQLPPLGEGEQASLTLTTASGGQREVAITVPQTLQGNAGGAVQL